MNQTNFTGSTWWVSEHDAEIVDRFYVTQLLWWQGFEQMFGPLLAGCLGWFAFVLGAARYTAGLTDAQIATSWSVWSIWAAVVVSSIALVIWGRVLSPKMSKWEWEGYCLMRELEDRQLAKALRRCEYKVSPRFWQYAHKIKVRVK